MKMSLKLKHMQFWFSVYYNEYTTTKGAKITKRHLRTGVFPMLLLTRTVSERTAEHTHLSVHVQQRAA